MAADLKNQFLLLQEQQKKKLLRRNKLKSEESNKKAAVEEVKFDKNLGLFSDGMDLDDDLNLKAVGLIENGIDDEEIKDMEETIRELRDENGRLYKLLGEKSEEMKILKRRWQDEKKELTGQSIGSENVAQRIIELSKKNRDLTAEVESGKTKYRQIQNEMQKLENELRKAVSKQKETQAPVSKEAEMKNENKTAELEAKMAQLNSKLMEYRNQVETQKKELKIAHKVLAKEVGDGVNIQSLLNSESNWRGRQQTIINLQKKVADLQQSVSSARQTSSRFSNSSVMSSMSYQSPLSVTMQDEKIRSTIKKMEMERKETQQKLQNDLNSLQNEHSRMKEKHDAAKTRNQVLTQELKNIKSQVATLIEKGKHDDDLVSALMREQEYLKNLNAKLVKDKEELESSSNNRVVKASHDIQINNELKKQVEEQEKKVKQLEDEIQSLKDAKTQEKHKENRINSANANVDGQLTQKPISRPSLIPTPPASADRKNGYRYRRTSSAKNEDISSLRVQLQEAKSMSQAAEVERDRLLELVQVLQNRINDATENCIVAENKTIELKRTNVKLEKQVERLKSNLNTKSQHGIHGKTRPTSKSRNGHREKSADEVYEEFEEMKTRLEIQADENDALKEALNSTLKAKNDDIKIYQEMVEQTKQIFIQGMKQFKQSTS